MSDCGLVHYLYMLGAFAVGLGAGHYWGQRDGESALWDAKRLLPQLLKDIQEVTRTLGPYTEQEKGSPRAKAIGALHTMAWSLYQWPKGPYNQKEKKHD